MPRHARGFTLVEIAITLMVIAVLSTIGFVGFRALFVSNQDKQAQSTLAFVAAAEQAHYADRGSYVSFGTDGAELSALLDSSPTAPIFLAADQNSSAPSGGRAQVSVGVDRRTLDLASGPTSMERLGLATLSESGTCFLHQALPAQAGQPDIEAEGVAGSCTAEAALALGTGSDSGAGSTVKAAVPTGFKAEAGNGQVHLSWDSVPGVSYTLQRTCLAGAGADSGACGSGNGTGSGSANWASGGQRVSTGGVYDDSGLTGGVTYVYTLYAQPQSTEATLCSAGAATTVGCSDPAGPLSVTPQDKSSTTGEPGLPPAPSITVTPGNTKITASWPAVLAVPAVSDYRISWRKATDADWTALDDGVSTATSMVIPGLVNGTQYCVSVRAVNSAGLGPAASACTTPTGLPGAPGRPSGSSVAGSDTKLDVSWTAATAGSSAITAYQLAYRETQGGAWKYAPTTGALARQLTGLSGGTQYTLKVRARSSQGYGPWSAEGTGTTLLLAAFPPNAVTGLTAVPVAVPVSQSAAGTPDPQLDRVLVVNWTAPVADATHGLASGYKVEFSPDGVTWTLADEANPYTPTVGLTIQSLDPTLSYRVRVTSNNIRGDGPPVTVGPVSPKVTPGVVTWVVGTDTGGSKARGNNALNPMRDLTVVWLAPTNQGYSGATVLDYKIEYRRKTAGNTQPWTTVATGNTTRTQGLPITALPNAILAEQYDVRVSARNQYGYGTQTPALAGAPSAPVVTMGIGFTPSTRAVSSILTVKVDMNFTFALTGDNNVGIDIYRRAPGTGPWTYKKFVKLPTGASLLSTYPFTATYTYTDPNAVAGTDYEYLVLARGWQTVDTGTLAAYKYTTANYAMPVTAAGAPDTVTYPLLEWFWRGVPTIAALRAPSPQTFNLTAAGTSGNYSGNSSTLTWDNPASQLPAGSTFTAYRATDTNGGTTLGTFTGTVASAIAYNSAAATNTLNTSTNVTTFNVTSGYSPTVGENVTRFYVAAYSSTGTLLGLSNIATNSAPVYAPLTTITKSRADSIGVAWTPSNVSTPLPVHHWTIMFRAAGTANAWQAYRVNGIPVEYPAAARSATLVTQPSSVPSMNFPQGSKWEITVLGFNEAGASKGTVATTNTLQAAADPPTVTLNSKAGTTWSLAWTAPVNNGGSPVLGYIGTVYWCVNGIWTLQTTLTPTTPAATTWGAATPAGASGWSTVTNDITWSNSTLAGLSVTANNPAGSQISMVLRAYTAVTQGDSVTIAN